LGDGLGAAPRAPSYKFEEGCMHDFITLMDMLETKFRKGENEE